jgi:hypothetical protein
LRQKKIFFLWLELQRRWGYGREKRSAYTIFVEKSAGRSHTEDVDPKE